MTPYKPNKGQRIATDVAGVAADRAFLAHLQLTAAQAAAADEDGVHAAITGSASAAVVVTTAITSPPYPRNIVITPGGTTDDVAAGNVVVEGTNIAGETISENFAFLANATGATTGNKAFKTVTKITVPQQDGAAATFTVGFGDKLGLPYLLTHNTVQAAFLDNAKEATAPTIATSATAHESNTADLNSALNGKVVDLYLFV